MVNVLDIISTLAWRALLLIIIRSLSACTFLFVSINATIFVRSSVRIYSSTTGPPFTTRNRCAGQNSEQHSREDFASLDNNTNSTPTLPKPTRQTGSPPNHSPRSLNNRTSPKPSKSYCNPSHESVMRMYEDIIASDAETIEVQQATMQSQQEIIRSQREMIQKLQQLVEAQDMWIEEHCDGPQG